MGLVIDNYSEEDYEFLLKINRSNMKDYIDRHFDVGWTDERHRVDFDDFIKNGKIYTLKYKKDIIGFFAFIVNKDKFLDLKELQIKTKFQGKGFGKECFLFIEEQVKKYKLNGIILTVFLDNPAKKLYEKLGFKKVKNRFEGKAILMQKILQDNSK